MHVAGCEGKGTIEPPSKLATEAQEGEDNGSQEEAELDGPGVHIGVNSARVAVT